MITRDMSRRYIDTGRINDDAIIYLAIKVAYNQPLEEHEKPIFYGETNRINNIIVALKENNML